MDKELQRKINKSLQRKGWVMRQDWCQLPYGWQSVWTMGYASYIVFKDLENDGPAEIFKSTEESVVID